MGRILFDIKLSNFFGSISYIDGNKSQNKQTDLNGDDLQKGWGDVVHTMPWCSVVGQKILSENKIVKNKPLQTKTTPKTKQAMIIELRKLSEALSYMY